MLLIVVNITQDGLTVDGHVGYAEAGKDRLKSWNLQLFAEGDEEENQNENQEDQENEDTDEEQEEEKRFTQKDVDNEVKKDCVDDVLALTRVYAGKEKDMDIEDAIDQILEKYPHFKSGTESEDGPEEGEQREQKGWGQRHGGKPAKNKKTLDDELTAQLFGK